MFGDILHRKCKTITAAAIIVGAAGLVSRFLGIIRDRILAGEFGAGDILDVYYAAFRVPDLVFNLLVLGALSAGFIPIFSSYLKRGIFKKDKINKEALDLANSILNIMGVGLIVLCTILIIFAHKIVPIITPGFTGEKLELTINMTRLMFLSPIFLGISSIFGGMLQTFRRFFVYSLAPIFYNIGIIIGALFFTDWWGIYGLAYGVILGTILHLLIQVPATFRLGYRYRWRFDWREKGVSLIGKLMVPRTLSLAIMQINLVVITIIASTLQEGSIAVFNLANNLQFFPIGIFGISYAIAVFPELSEHANEGDKENFIHNLSHTLRQILFFIIPASIVFLLLRAQIVRVILGAGEFGWSDTIRTADALAFFSLSLFAQSLIPLFARGFYAYKNTIIPFVIGLVSALVNVLASVIFSRELGVAGLALAFSMANIVNLVLLWVAMRIKIGDLEEIEILSSVVKFSIAALVMAVFIQLIKGVVGPLVDMTKFWGIFIQGVSAGIVGMGAYFGILYLLKSEEFLTFKSALVRKLFKTKLPESGADESRGV